MTKKVRYLVLEGLGRALHPCNSGVGVRADLPLEPFIVFQNFFSFGGSRSGFSIPGAGTLDKLTCRGRKTKQRRHRARAGCVELGSGVLVLP